jgi:hypothetical protein
MTLALASSAHDGRRPNERESGTQDFHFVGIDEGIRRSVVRNEEKYLDQIMPPSPEKGSFPGQTG